VNLGKLLADGGVVKAFAGTLKHSGDIRANALVRDAGGEIALVAQKDIEIPAGSSTAANGRSGGSVVIDAGGAARVAGSLSATGSAGKGGLVQVTGDKVSLVDNAVLD